MTLAVFFRRPALREFEAAVVWYEEQRRNLGGEFETEVVAAIQSATEQPMRFPRVLREIRCAQRLPCSA